jgi:hypothetical protein
VDVDVDVDVDVVRLRQIAALSSNSTAREAR